MIDWKCTKIVVTQTRPDKQIRNWHTFTVCSRIVGFVSRNPWATCGKIWSFTICGWKWLMNKSSCCNNRERVTRSVDANNFTTHGTIRFWYSISSNSLPNLNIGASTAEPASPYSNAVISCGKIFWRHTLSGKLSNWLVNAPKKRFFSALSFIWISSKNNNVSTRSFLKNPLGFRHLVIISAGFGRLVGDAPTNSQYKLVNDFGIYCWNFEREIIRISWTDSKNMIHSISLHYRYPLNCFDFSEVHWTIPTLSIQVPTYRWSWKYFLHSIR